LKKRISAILGMLLCLTLAQPVAAEEITTSNIDISTQKSVEDLLVEYPDATEYIQNVINAYVESGIENIDSYIMDAVNSVRECKAATQERAKKVQEQTEKRLENSLISTFSEPYDTMLMNYGLGISLVRAAGCPHAADYMEHAIVPEGSSASPSKVFHKGDSWAEEIIYCDTIQSSVTNQFESEILATGATSGTVSNTVHLTDSKDMRLALGHVDYSVTFTKMSNGYQAYYYISDCYDFDWSSYDDVLVGFGNNYCYAMQQAGYIKPFDIVITG